MGGTKTFMVIVKEKMEQFATQDSIYRHKTTVLLVQQDANNVQAQLTALNAFCL